ncbi:MAG: M16 family metallopeptidase, partial [Syntrophales bacterium]
MKRAHARISEISFVILITAAVLVFLLPAAWASAEVRTADENILRASLENGLRVVIVRNTQAPVISIIVNYLVGSNEAPEGFPGMAHAQEHMMFRGSPGLSADQLADIIALMGGNFNADTQQTVTQYSFTCAKEDFDIAMRIESIRMQGILDSEESWKEERGAIEQEVAQDLSDPDYIFYAKLLEIMFKDTPYAHTPLGTLPSFEKTTGVMLKTFYDAWYAPNNAILVIVGHVEPRQALKDVEKYFSPIPRKNIPQRPAVRLGPLKPESFTMSTDQSHGLAAISFRMPGYGSGDYAASEVLADVLSSQRGSLFELVVSGKALDIDFNLLTLPAAGMAYAAASFPKGTDPKPLIQEIRRILTDDVRKGF